VVVEKKRSHMVIENVEQHIRLLLFEPDLDGLEALENWRPGSLILFVVIDGKADGGCVGYSEATNDACHNEFLCTMKVLLRDHDLTHSAPCVAVGQDRECGDESRHAQHGEQQRQPQPEAEHRTTDERTKDSAKATDTQHPAHTGGTEVGR